ncbi:DUF853 family protein [Mycoplasma miroungigenitalium]|uniref:DUF853 family protein n=1 Tax=Mycoplasma miroungigenitalium TaxID=754515 RepID=A0A6M4JCI4_9MOLU|nr:ATP-binding protein [Mycoplasma miroungigenitalium]QJR43769.1 DUF853 family protein [Mycoplasma miroungigenitalium]
MTWYDLAIFCLIVIAEFLIVIFGIPQISAVYRLIIPLVSIFPTMLLFINVKNTSYKVYQLFWVWLKFLSSKKKFSQDEINNLLVFKTIDKTGILSTDSTLSKKKIKAQLFKLNGNSIFKYDASTQESLLITLATSLSTISNSLSIIKLNNKGEFKENTYVINQKLTKYVDSNSQNYLSARRDDIYKFKNSEYQEYHLLIYGDNEFCLKENIHNVKFAFESVNFLISELSQTETLLFYSNYYSLNQSLADIELKIVNTDSTIINIIDVLNLNSIEFAKNYFKLNNNFYSVQSVSEFDYEVDNGWINTIYNTDSNVILNINKLSFKHAESLLEGSNRTIGTNAFEKTHHLLRNQKRQYEYEIFNELIENVAKNQSKPLLDIGVYFLNKSNTTKVLSTLENKNIQNAKKEKITLRKFHYEQFKCWNQSQLPATDVLNTSIQALPELIAFGWPWNLELLNDSNDFILATQLTDESPVFFDLFHRNTFRRNSNCIIIGTSGSGKSTMSKKLLLNEYYDNAQILIIDPQNEYKSICKQVKGQYIDLKDGDETIINPLEIQINEFNENNTKVFNIIVNHIDFLGDWISILFRDLDSTDLILIKTALKSLYNKNKFYDCESIEDLKNTAKWPIMNDLINELENTRFNSKLEKNIYEIPLAKLIKEFKFYFQELTTYKSIFNQQSNTNLDNKFIVFNVKKLLSQQNQDSAMAQIFLLLKIINTKISINSINKSYHKTILFIDEAHFALKDNTPQLREFIIDTTKTIRKYNGSIILATQNVIDISANASKILGNIQYSFFFACKQKDIDAITELYRTSQSLTKQELKFIANAKTGECLMFLTEKQHYQIAINYNNLEQDLFFNDFKEFIKYIKVVKIDINSLIERISDAESKNEFITEYDQSCAEYESKLTIYSAYKQYLAFLCSIKQNLIETLKL